MFVTVQVQSGEITKEYSVPKQLAKKGMVFRLLDGYYWKVIKV